MRIAISTILAVLLLAGTVAPIWAGEPVDVNTADSLQLEKLYRVGPALASRIIAEREKNGPYISLADVAARVKNIGPKTIANWEGSAVAIVH